MDDLDRRILHALQHDFPLAEHPYEVIAAGLGIPAELLIERVRGLLDDGVIRRVGVSLDSRKLGFPSTLCAVRVAADRVDRAAGFIGRYPEVTHSYLRDHPFNIWFTLIASSQERITEILQEIAAALDLGPADVLNLPMKTAFKLDARFDAQTLRPAQGGSR